MNQCLLAVLTILTILTSHFLQAASTRCITNAQCSLKEPSICARTYCVPLTTSQRPSYLMTTTRRSFITLVSLIDEVNATPLSHKLRARVCTQAATLLSECNPHRFMQVNQYGVDAARALRNLAKAPPANQSTFEFHMAVRDIFASMNDLHTLYQFPAPLVHTTATLGFTSTGYYNNGVYKVIVKDVIQSFPFRHGKFTVGVDILSVDGVAVETHAMQLGKLGYASNAAAQLAFGTAAISERALILHPVPKTTFSKVVFAVPGASTHTVDMPWVFVKTDNEAVVRLLSQHQTLPHMSHKSRDNVPKQSLLKRQQVHAVKAHMPDVGRANNIPFVTEIPVSRKYQTLFAAEVRKTVYNDIGVLTISSFLSRADDSLFKELTRILRLMPANGLVIDVRVNSGGYGDFGKMLTELISDTTVPTSQLQMRASKLNLRILEAQRGFYPDLKELFLPGVSDAFRAGEQFGVPAGNAFTFGLGDSGGWEKRVRAYNGPVVTLAGGRTYSAAEAFVSVQRDLGSSLVVGVDASTAGGGATPVRYNNLMSSFPDVFQLRLPAGVDFSLAFLRFFRLGNRTGGFIEGVGVEPDVRYLPTRNDALFDDCDLFDFVAKRLATIRPL